MRMVGIVAACTLLASVAPDSPAAESVTIEQGDYRAVAGAGGLAVYHRDQQLSLGSYFSVYNPGYKGTIISFKDFWEAAKVTSSGTDLEAAADLPNGQVAWRVGVSANGVTVDLDVTVAKDAKPGPTEYAAFQIPPALVDGGTVEILNVAGTTIQEKPVPGTPKRGGMTRSGDTMSIHTPERIIEVTTGNGIGVHAFDARVERYGKRQGLWAFSGVPVTPGYETTVQRRIRVLPPPAPRPAGAVHFADGTPLKRILIRVDATEREKLAASETADYVEEICGKTFDVTSGAGDAGTPGDLVLGELAVTAGLVSRDDLAPLERDGYMVRIEANRGAVCGWRDLGTIYGAYALIRQLGVHFYAPGCETIPRTANLTIPTCELRKTPLLEFRKTTQDLKLGHTPSDDLGSPREIGEPGGLVHAAHFLVPFDKYHDEHPEYFALQKDGKRLHRDPNAVHFWLHLCMSNPDVVRISCERMMMLMDAQPDRTFFGVSQGDGHAWCRCEKCQAMDTEPGNVMTDRLITYVNEIARYVAKKHPEKRILTLAYTKATSPPPIRVKPEPNVMVQFCPYPGRVFCQSHFLDCEKNLEGFEDIKGWLKLAPNNMYVFDYPRGYKIWYEPFGSFYAMKQKMQYYLDHGIRGMYYCGVPTNFTDLFVYVQSAMHWDRNVDVEALIDEFMPAYYGKAAPFIREYFDAMHREVVDRQVHQMCEGRCPGIMTPEFTERARAMFAEAEAAVADDPVALYRVHNEKFCILFADLNERNPVNGEMTVSQDEFARRLGEFMTLGRKLRRRTVGRRDDGIVSDWLFRVCRLRTHTEPWFADALCRRMIKAPEKTFAAERKLFCQKPIEGGLLIELDAFVGCNGPQEYAYECPAQRAVWIYGSDSKTPKMHADFELDAALPPGARLVLTGQDDDKPGVVEIEISINGKPVFTGPNGCVQNNWSTLEVPLEPGVAKAGRNILEIRTLRAAPKHAGWFMLADCKIMFGAWK